MPLLKLFRNLFRVVADRDLAGEQAALAWLCRISWMETG